MTCTASSFQGPPGALPRSMVSMEYPGAPQSGLAPLASHTMTPSNVKRTKSSALSQTPNWRAKVSSSSVDWIRKFCSSDAVSCARTPPNQAYHSPVFAPPEMPQPSSHSGVPKLVEVSAQAGLGVPLSNPPSGMALLSGTGGTGSVQDQLSSTWHMAEQPSPSSEFPSSHCSPASRTPLPQLALVEIVMSASLMSKKMLERHFTITRPVLVEISGTVISALPSLGVLASRLMPLKAGNPESEK